MSEVTAHTTKIMGRLFDKTEHVLLKRLSRLIAQSQPDLSEMWEYDKSIGGLGGYAMPSSPVINPFNTWGKDRNLFRSVQYAKSGFIYYPHSPRNIIMDAGRSLEWTCKYILDYRKIIPRNNNQDMLGKNLERMHRKKLIDDDLYEVCKLFIKIYNVAKHEITDSRPRTFSAIDAIVAYFALRKIHNTLLGTINHPKLHYTYPIYQDAA